MKRTNSNQQHVYRRRNESKEVILSLKMKEIGLSACFVLDGLFV